MKRIEAFFQHSIKQPCESISRSGFWRLSLSLRSLLGHWVASLSKVRNAPAYQELAGVLTASRRATSNNRTYIALILFLVVAPLSDVAYLWLDKSAPVITWFADQHWVTYEGIRVEGWYYKNFFWLFYQLGPHIQDLVLYTGAFCLVHRNDKRRWLAAIAMGFPFAKIMWAAQITSDAEIHQIVHWSLLLIGALIGLVWLVLFEYLMNLHYHKRSGSLARAFGILKSPGIPDSQKVSIALQEFETYNSLK